MKFRRRIIGAALASTMLGLIAYTVPSGANPPGSWNAHYYTNGSVGGPVNVTSGTGAVASFGPGYLATIETTNSQFTGDLLGATLAAGVSTQNVASGDCFEVQGFGCISASNTNGLTPATVRFFFISKAKSTASAPYSGTLGAYQQNQLSVNGSPVNPAFGLAPAAYYTQTWWSDSVNWPLVANSVTTIVTTIAASDWSDWNGQLAANNVAAFDSAASNILAIGVSFGGGYFFENGVTTQNGTGSFVIDSFNVSH